MSIFFNNILLAFIKGIIFLVGILVEIHIMDLDNKTDFLVELLQTIFIAYEPISKRLKSSFYRQTKNVKIKTL